MKLHEYISIFFLFCSVFSAVQAINNVPVFMWNIDTDVKVNPLNSLTSGELVEKLGQSFHDHIVAVFIQDELSIEDFKEDGGLNGLQAIADSSNEGTFYTPSVTSPENIPENLKAKGFNVINVKAPQDLPREASDKNTVLIIQLPSTNLGDSRSDNLQLNANVVSQIYEVLKSQHPDIVGIFTGKQNDKAALGKHVRVARSEGSTKDAASSSAVGFCNVTNQLYLYLENAPVLRWNDRVNNIKANFTFYTMPDCSQSSTIGSSTAELVLVYSSANGTQDATLNSAKIKISIAAQAGYWSVRKIHLDVDAVVNGQILTPGGNGSIDLNPADIATPLSFSYHCSIRQYLGSKGFEYSEHPVNQTYALEMNGFQLQAFYIRDNSFGDWYDCQGFFTEGIWAGIFLGLIIAMMLAWAVSMLADIRTPDRFDDPKGKTITITATD